MGIFVASIDEAKEGGAKLVLIDGVKAEYDHGWALMRASVTEPASRSGLKGICERI
jgi:phosphomannomutase